MTAFDWTYFLLIYVWSGSSGIFFDRAMRH
jgi:hypothetical protein